MDIGLYLPQEKNFAVGKDVPVVAKAAEEIGFSSLWVWERALFPQAPVDGMYGIQGLPWDDLYRSNAHPLTILTLAAAVTERVELATAVLVAGLNGPFQLARQLATLDNASGGRVIAGFGTGWSRDEYAAAGVVPFERRGEAMDELLDVCEAVWGPDPVSYQGKLSTIPPSEVGPKPARPIPIHLAAAGPRGLRRVVERAAGWLPLAVDPDMFAAQSKKLNELAETHGREDKIVTRLQTFAVVTPDRVEDEGRQAFVGTLEQVIQDAVAFSDAAPVDEINIGLPMAQNVTELVDTASALYSGLRAAGL
jgi:probable F420-dependent oxidoreductase